MLASVLLLFISGSTVLATHLPSLKNVLMIAIDDMRPELNASYGFEHMHTPHTDALAAKGTTFTRAYVQVAVCMPSRQAIMTSRRPDTSMGWTISPNQHFRHCGGSCGANVCSGYPASSSDDDTSERAAPGRQCGIPDLVTMPGWFYKNGYTTIGHGKNFHESDTGGQDYNYSWTPAHTVGMPTGICKYQPHSRVV
jgi:arylsulfatase A-like enzyme